MTSTALVLAAKKKKPAAKKTAAKKTAAKKPAAKKTAAKKTAAKKTAEPAPTDAQLDAVLDLIEDAAEMDADLYEAATADTVAEYVAALGAASTKLARVMRRMAALAERVDPGAFAAAQAKALALPAAKPPALAQ